MAETLYDHAGGAEGLHRLEELFYDKVLADPVLETLFSERVPTHVDHLTWFTAESFGGPGRFTSELGFRYIIDVHRGLKITDEQRERFVALYLEALDEAGLPDDGPFRQAVREHVEFGAQVAQQNSWAQTDDELHPIREVPRWNWSQYLGNRTGTGYRLPAACSVAAGGSSSRRAREPTCPGRQHGDHEGFPERLPLDGGDQR